MASAYLDSLDIANRAIIHLGVRQIASVDEDSKNNRTMAALYDVLRQAELRRNVWKFAKRKCVVRPIESSTRILRPNAWEEDTLYLPGSIVMYANEQYWISFEDENRGNEPGTSNVWEHYYGPLSVSLYASSNTGYYAGELVYVPIEDKPGAFVVFYSRVAGNSDDPTVVSDWDEDATYGLDEVVSYASVQWRSVIPVNIGVTPDAAPADWSEVTTYASGNSVVGSDGFIWTSDGSGNIGHDPVDSTGFWSSTGIAYAWEADPTIYNSSSKWVPIFADLKNVSLEATNMGLGLQGQAIYKSPAGALRDAKVDPRSNQEDTAQALGQYFVDYNSVRTFAFVADITDVTTFDPMFCEGLASRMAIEACEALVQKSQGGGSLLATLTALYGKFMTEARTVNAIEVGTEEADEDEYLTCRR